MSETVIAYEGEHAEGIAQGRQHRFQQAHVGLR